MSPRFDPHTLDQLAAEAPTSEQPYLRIGLDTGGIAAGSHSVYEYFTTEAANQPGIPPVKRVGSNGLSWADPLVELNVDDMPPILYGAVDQAVAGQILKQHILGGKLVDDHVLAYPNAVQSQAAATKPSSKKFILVKDTSCHDGDKTEFFQFTLQEELKRQKLDQQVQVVRALDLGVHDEGMVIRILPSGSTYANVLTSHVANIITESIKRDGVIKKLKHEPAVLQERIVMRDCGIIDPVSYTHLTLPTKRIV